MEHSICVLTVLFEAPFWVGIYERQFEGQYQICKITFGAEPKDYEVYSFLLNHWADLRFGSFLCTEEQKSRPSNPKRMQRAIHRQLQSTGVGTKAQQALKLQQEHNKQARKHNSREKRLQEKEQEYLQQQQKRKEKHRGH